MRDDADELRAKLYPPAPALGQVLLERAVAIGAVYLAFHLYRLWMGH